MDHVFSPWRFRYISQPRTGDACVLCAKLAEPDGPENLVVFRGSACAVIVNAFPYTSGHAMILPLAHLDSLAACGPAVRAEMIELAARCEDILGREYRPDGINFGINLGEAAGAGIAGHLHLHAVPRWRGDANFMTVVAETRVLPEELSRTYERLRAQFATTQRRPGAM